LVHKNNFQLWLSSGRGATLAGGFDGALWWLNVDNYSGKPEKFFAKNFQGG
jgi:hypothetical protein